MGSSTEKVERNSQSTPLANDVLQMLQGQLSQGAFGMGVGPHQRDAGNALRQFINSGPGEVGRIGNTGLGMDFGSVLQGFQPPPVPQGFGVGLGQGEGGVGRLGTNLPNVQPGNTLAGGGNQPGHRVSVPGQPVSVGTPPLQESSSFAKLIKGLIGADQGASGGGVRLATPQNQTQGGGGSRGNEGLTTASPDSIVERRANTLGNQGRGTGGGFTTAPEDSIITRTTDTIEGFNPTSSPAQQKPDVGRVNTDVNLQDLDLSILDRFLGGGGSGVGRENTDLLGNDPGQLGGFGSNTARGVERDTGQLRDALRAESDFTANRQSDDLREAFGAVGSRFGTALSRGEADLRSNLGRDLNSQLAQLNLSRADEANRARQFDTGIGLQSRGQDLQALLGGLQGGVTQRGQDISARGQDASVGTNALNSILGARGQDLQGMLGSINAGLGQRSQDIQALLGQRGQDLTARGQDINAGLGSQQNILNAMLTGRGQDINQRGQDIQNQQFGSNQQLAAIQQMFNQGQGNIQPFLQLAQMGILPEEILQNPSALGQLGGGLLSGAAGVLGGPAGGVIAGNVFGG